MKRLLILTALVISFIFAGKASAVVLDQFAEGSLGYLEEFQYSITAGDKIFDTWSYSLGVDGVGGDLEGLTEVIPDPGHIMVTPLNDGGLDPGPGLQFYTPDSAPAALTVQDGQYMHLQIGFRVTTIGDLLIKDNSLTFNNATIETVGEESYAGVYIREFIHDVAGKLLGEKYIEFSVNVLDGGTTRLYPDSVTFSPIDEIFVTKDIFLWATPGDRTALYRFEQRFSQTPEPATMFLLGTGLVGVAGAARRKRKNQA